jgi:hypothetical protein
MNRKTFVLASLVILAAVTLVGRAASAEARVLKSFKPCAPAQTVMVIPDNVLTGHGALATPDGIAHF